MKVRPEDGGIPVGQRVTKRRGFFNGETVDHTGGRDKVFPKHSGKGSRRVNVVTLGLWRMLADGKKCLRVSKAPNKNRQQAQRSRAVIGRYQKMKDKRRGKKTFPPLAESCSQV